MLWLSDTFEASKIIYRRNGGLLMKMKRARLIGNYAIVSIQLKERKDKNE